MEFSYQRAIGELLFTVITCRPAILYAIIKLSQYNNILAYIHYTTVKWVFKYLRDSIDNGLHYWRPELQPSLTQIPLPTLIPYNHPVALPDLNTTDAHYFVDSDWVGDTLHRKYISGIWYFVGAPVV